MAPITTVHVKEITRARPRTLRVAVRDQEVVKYAPEVNPAGVEAGSYLSNVSRLHTSTGLTEVAAIVGRNKDYLKFYDVKPTAFADRAAMDNPANYPTIGGRTCTAVYRSSLPYEQAKWYVSQEVNQSVFEHLLYLEYDGDIPDGTYTISITGNTFPATSFTLDDKYTRCCAISATHLGHRPADGSKLAYMQLWLPNGPNEGAVNLAADHGLSDFHIINTKQQTVFSGTAVQICTPTSDETGYTNTYFPSMNTAPQTATAVNSATDTVTKAGHGYLTGQVKLFRGFAGTNLEGVPWYVTVVDANNFTVQGFDVNTNLPTGVGFTGTWVPNTYIAAHDGKIYDTYLRNRYGTYVYKLDYSAFVPTDPAERYKVYVPGFGVSDEFVMHDAVWHKFARNAFKGVYHQAIGIPLTAAIGGWDRPVWGRDGVNGCEIYETMLPGNMHSENVVASPLPADYYTSWITTTRVTGFRGGFADAGDHDWHTQRHFPELWTMVDIAYDRLDPVSRATNFGFPRASATFGDQTSIYNGIDAMPDVIHIALHFCEGLRQTQKVDGRVYSGMNFHSPRYPTSSDGAAGNRWDPSWLSPYNPHLLAADHLSNYAYAAMAAKLGKIFQAAGHTSLGQTWIDSAESAFQWAEDIYQGYAVSGIASTAWDDYYDVILDIRTRSGLSDPDLTTHFDSLQTQCTDMRMFAVYNLYVAYAAQSPDTGSAAYFAILDPLGTGVTMAGYGGLLGLWEYTQGPTGDAGDKAYYNGRWYIPPENNIYTPGLSGNRIYKYSGSGTNPWPSSPNNLLIYAFLTSDLRSAGAYAKDNTNIFLKYLQAGEGYNTGANPYDSTCVTGIGTRQPHVLFLDREAMGVASYDIPGFPCYMGTGSWATANIQNGLSTDGALAFTSSLTAVGDANSATGGAKKLVEPYHNMIPHGLTHYRNTLGIYPTEFDLGGPVFGRLTNALFLHGWDGNDNTAEPKTRFWARCV